ncbi:hypothetical protein PPROV_001040400 [Pycnococcus provasolii]|uniref:Uncharacterized protein n=1 Tax=Pycnococcus provasolii TaxID=41880 RepID=A0A830HW72_9CHLO|nr:hypothetical protein PPROV_001040400 [Pycnococcus provasolii]
MYYATTIVEDLTLYDIFTLNSIDVSDRKELLSACEDGTISLMLGILGKPRAKEYFAQEKYDARWGCDDSDESGALDLTTIVRWSKVVHDVTTKIAPTATGNDFVIRAPRDDEKAQEFPHHALTSLPSLRPSYYNAATDHWMKEHALHRFIRGDKAHLYHKLHMDFPDNFLAELRHLMRLSRRASPRRLRTKLVLWPRSVIPPLLKKLIEKVQAHIGLGDFVRAQINLRSIYHHPHFAPMGDDTITIAISVGGSAAVFVWGGSLYLLQSGTVLFWTVDAHWG